MVNKNYIKGRDKEYNIVKKLKGEGFDIAQRTAGSHSPIDIFAINKKLNLIKFVQVKPNDFSKKEYDKIMRELNYLNNTFKVKFEIK